MYHVKLGLFVMMYAEFDNLYAPMSGHFHEHCLDFAFYTIDMFTAKTLQVLPVFYR